VNPNLTTFPSAPGNPWESIANPPAGGTTPTAPGTAPQPNPQYGGPAQPGQPAPTNPWTATANAASLLRNLPYQTMQGFQNIAQARTQAGHRTGPGVSSADLGYGYVYDAPADVQRRYWVAGSTGREPGGAAKGDSGWRLLQDRMRQLQAQGMTYQQALMNTMDWFSRQAQGGDISRYGFRRAA
jgi:hypothetical protein